MKAFPFLNEDGTLDTKAIDKHIPLVMAHKELTEEQAREKVMFEANRQKREFDKLQHRERVVFPNKGGNVLKGMFAVKYAEYDKSWR